ncbi:MAG: InlB B-repeat-containing protein [Dehalogenimonas sp.]
MEARKINQKGWLGRYYRAILYPAIFLILAITMALSMAAPVGAAATSYFRPNLDISIPSDIYGNGGDPQYQYVNDQRDGSFLICNFHNVSEDWKYARFGLPDHDPALNGITTINSVTVWARVSREAFAKSGSALSGCVRTLVRINGTNYGGSGYTPPVGAIENISTTYEHVPGTTSTDWTWADIDNLEVGIGMRSPGADSQFIVYYDWVHSTCHEVWVVVDYSIATTTTVASSNNPSGSGDSVTFTATVTRAGGSNTPTGTVTFKDGANTLGTGTLSGSGASATATYTTSALPDGSHSITAVYGGNSYFLGSTSAPLTQVVGNILTTGNASNVTLTSATLNGSRSNSNGALVACFFQYGTSISYTNSTTPMTSTYGDVNFSAAISGLTEGVTYHYRAAGFDYGIQGYVYGEDKTFTPRHNYITTNDATLVFNTGATLNGSLSNFDATMVACYFQYGTTAAYGSDTSSTSEGLSANGTFSKAITGLTEGTTYHFRAVGYIWGGATVYGQDKTFVATGPPIYSVTFDGNGGSTPTPTSKYVTYGSPYGELATVSRTGCTFAGWFTAASGGSQVTAATTVNITTNQTLYAHWTGNNYTVTFNANGGVTPTPTSKQVTFGSAYGTLATTSRTGYIFDGWFTDPSPSGNVEITASTILTFATNHTLYAHWTADNVFTVTFNGNGGGTPSPASKSVTNGSTYGTLATVSRTGYTFAGWYTDAAAGTLVESTTTVTITAPQTLYAHWTANQYTVTFNGNGGGTPSPTSKQVTYDSTYGTLATVSRTGYTFAGWFTAASGGSQVNTGTTVAITGPQTLYAHWTASQYTVTFNGNGGGTPSPTSKQVTYDSTYGTLATVSRTGYTFAGWFTAASGGSQVNTGTTVAITGPQTLYAHWTANQYTVTFNGNGGGTPSPTTKQVTYDSTYGTLATVSRTGYAFAGWFTAASGGSQVNTGTTVAITGPQTLYAHWVDTLITNDATSITGHGATLNGTLNNPNDGRYSCYFEYGTTISYGSSTYGTPGNYTYTELYASSGFSYTISGLAAGTTYHFRAIAYDWTIQGYVYGADKTFTTSLNNVTTNDATSPTLYGATLNGTLDDYSNASPYNATAKQAFFEWGPTTSYGSNSAISYTSMTGNGSFSFVLTDLTFTPGTTYHYRAAVLMNLAGGGTVVHYGLDKTFTTANTITVTFNGNGGGTPSPASKIVTVGSTYGTLATVSRAGYTFAGWFTLAAGGSEVTAGTTVTTGTNQTLYAHWTANQYTVTFNGNGGGTPSPTSKQVTYDSTYGTLATVSRTGYTFAGWFTAASGGSQVNTGTTVAITGPQTLFAHWTANQYTVTFNGNGGGTPSPTTKQVTYDSTYGTLATISRTGYTFAGWFTAASGGTEITAGTTVAITAPQTLFAHWTANTYLVTFDSNGGGTPSPTTKNVTYDSTYGALATVSHDGYTFAGWFTLSTGGTQVSASDTVAITAPQTLYAHWSNTAPAITSNGGNASATVNVAENTTAVTTVTVNDPDPGTIFTFSLSGGADSAKFSIGSATGVLVFISAPNFESPTDSGTNNAYDVIVQVSDGSLTDTQTIAVTVTNVNEAPILGAIGNKNANELVSLGFTATATDPDLGASLTFSLADGTSGDVPSGASINSSTGAFSWTPTEAQGPGTYTFDVVVSDGALTDSETITVNVAEVNVAPVLGAIGNKNVDELVALTFTATATDADLPANTKTFSLADGTSGDVPSGASINSSTGAFSWTPTEAQGPGTYTFDVVVSDGALTDSETITVNVAEVNVAPVLGAIGNKNVDELVALTFTATATDADLPANTKTFSLADGTSGDVPSGASINSSTGAFTWTPTEAQGPGSYTFDVVVSDGALTDFETITVTVAEVNVAPVFTHSPVGSGFPELGNWGFAVTATDADVPVQTLTFSLIGAPTGMAIDSSGTLTWTPTEAQGPGTFNFTLRASDGIVNTDVAAWVEVFEVNVAPVLGAIGNKNVDELVALTFTATATDADLPANTKTFSLADGTSGDVPSGASINSSTGAFSWTPTEAQGPGTYTFDVVVSDGTATDFETITVTVNEVNVAPVLGAIGPKSVNEGSALTFTATATDADIPANSKTFSLDDGTAGSVPAGASINSSSGAFSWTPADGNSSATFDVVVSDGALSDSETITVTVNNVAPAVDAGAATASINENTTFTRSGSFTDPGDDAWTATVDYGDGGGAVVLTLTGKTFSLSHTYADNGVYTVTVTVTETDPEAAFGSDTITVTVNNVNPVPDGDPESQTVQYSDPIGTITIEAIDVSGDTLNASTQWKLGAGVFTNGLFDDLVLSGASTPIDNGDGTSTTTWTIDGIANAAPGIYTIRITVQDGDGGSDSYDVTVTVVKEAAVITFDSDNIVALQVTASGSGIGNLGSNVFKVYVTQQNDGHLGLQALNSGDVSARLVPVGGGGPISLSQTSFDIGTFLTGGKATYTFGTSSNIPLETYTLEITLSNIYYAAPQGEDAFVVYDPTSAFTTGGGWFNWPQDGSPLAGVKTNFGFTMKYNNKGQQVQGSLIIIAHLPDGSIYRIKSNALYGLALNNLTGIATFSGKCTYLYPNPIPGGDPINVGGQEFMIYIDDNNNPGDGIDQFWFNMLGQPFSLDGDTDNQADSVEIQPINGGNIVAPHIAAGQVTNPTVTLVSPDEGIRGSTIEVVTITGTGFNGATKVSFGAGITVTELTVVSDTEISVKITISSKTKAGTRDVTVTTSGGSGTLKGGFTVS